MWREERESGTCFKSGLKAAFRPRQGKWSGWQIQPTFHRPSLHIAPQTPLIYPSLLIVNSPGRISLNILKLIVHLSS